MIYIYIYIYLEIEEVDLEIQIDNNHIILRTSIIQILFKVLVK